MEALKPKISVTKLFRLKNWQGKISSIRPLFYVFLAYAFAVNELSLVSLLNLIIVSLIISSSYLFNDYHDNLLRGDKNYTSESLRSGTLNARQIKKYICAALVVALLIAIYLLTIIENPLEISALLLFGFLLAFSYSSPHTRLKDSSLGPLIFPIAATTLFLESWLVHQSLTILAVIMLILVFIYQNYLELLHLINDTQDPKEIIRITASQARFTAFLVLQAGFLLTLLAGTIYNPVFLIGSIFWLIRGFSLYKTTDNRIEKNRFQLLNPILSVYEFLIYAILGITSTLS